MPVLEHTGNRALSVERSELVSVLGAPGTGKTRLALELAYLARPQEGEVLFHGVNVTANRRSRNRRPREITMLVQNAEDQLFARTVYDDVAFGPRHLDVTEAEIDLRVVRALDSVGLNPASVRDRSPFALSGGERRRVALAGVLAMEPEVLILDEPTSNLDPGTRDAFLDLLQPLRNRSAIVWFTTRAREATLADRIYLLQEGRALVADVGAELLRDWRRLSAAGVELPQIYALASALERRGAELSDVATADEMLEAIIAVWRDRRDGR